MKYRLIICVLIIIMLFTSACSSAVKTPAPTPTIAEATTTPTIKPTPIPTPSPTPEPDGVEGIVLIENADVIFSFLNAGEEVVVTGEQEGYYSATIDDTSVLIDKRLVRLTSESDYEIWSGFAARNATLFDNLFLEGQPINTLNMNTAIEVLDDLGFCYRVQLDGTIGYMSLKNISKTKLNTGGGGGGSSGGADGGDIVLPGFKGNGAEIIHASIFIRPEGECINYPENGIILADNVEAYLGFLQLGDHVKVTDESNSFYTIIFSHQLGTIRTQLVRLSASDKYSTWDGYAKRNTPYYNNYHMTGDPMGNLSVNTVITILCELDYGYYVNLDGASWFVPKDFISAEKIDTGGSNGSGSGGDWTNPEL